MLPSHHPPPLIFIVGSDLTFFSIKGHPVNMQSSMRSKHLEEMALWGSKSRQVAAAGKQAQWNSCQIQYLKALEDSKMQDLMRCDSKSLGRWTREEHLNFLEGLRVYGKNWKKIQQLVQTRSGSQIRSHAQKFFLKLRDPAKSDLSEHTQNSPDFQPDAEELVANSKMVSETGVAEEDFSYFLTKIVEYVNDKNWMNFWTDLIDCKSNTPAHQAGSKCHSFMVIGGDYKQQSSTALFHK